MSRSCQVHDKFICVKSTCHSLLLAMSIPATRDEWGSQLDALSLRALELTQEIVEARAAVEAAQREGYILLAKTRYSGAAVSFSQVPGKVKY